MKEYNHGDKDSHGDINTKKWSSIDMFVFVGACRDPRAEFHLYSHQSWFLGSHEVMILLKLRHSADALRSVVIPTSLGRVRTIIKGG
jgi:hypothetical protein